VNKSVVYPAKKTNLMLSMLIITRCAMVVMVISMPAAVGEDDAATQGQESKQGNRQCDSTKHFKILMGYRAMKSKLVIGCNIRPRLQPLIPAER
jgi:zona occludens toxin (predicted ATPase)